MRLSSILFAIALLMLSGCVEQDSANKKFTFMQGEFNYAKKDSNYSSKSMFKLDQETGEAWRMNFKNGHWMWQKIEHTD